MKLAQYLRLVVLALAAVFMIPKGASAQSAVEGQVLLGGEPIASATVTLWTAGADAPAQVAQTQTGADGRLASIEVDKIFGDERFLLFAEPAITPARCCRHRWSF